MKLSKLERRTNLVSTKIGRIRSKVGTANKGVQPYRQPPIPPKEQLYYFSTEFTPEKEQMFRQDLINQYGDVRGNQMMNDYLEKMAELGGRYGGSMV